MELLENKTKKELLEKELLEKEYDDFLSTQDKTKYIKTKFGWRATWQNYTHPENENFSQIVFWTAIENILQKHVTIQYSLSYHGPKEILEERISIGESFQASIRSWQKRNKNLAFK